MGFKDKKQSPPQNDVKLVKRQAAAGSKDNKQFTTYITRF